MRKICVKYIILVLITYWFPVKPILSLEFKTNLKTDTSKSECVKKLIAAVDQLNTEETKRIIEEGCDINWPVPDNHYEYFLPITCALSKGDTTMLSILLSHGADPNLNLGSYYTPFQYAIKNCSLPIVKLLVGYLSDVNFLFPSQETYYQNSPLNFAIISRRTDVVKFFIENGAMINGDVNRGLKTTSLALAISDHLIDIVNILLDHGADINAQFTQDYEDCLLACPDKITVVHDVAGMSSWPGEEQYANTIMDLLLTHQPDLNIVNGTGVTPLGFACFTTNTQLVEKLIAHGANPDIGDYPALNCAAMLSNDLMTKYLLSINVNPNQRDCKGNIPLITNIQCCGDGFQDGITEKNRINTLTALINAGADPSIKNLRGESFLDLLKQANLPEIETLLKQKGLLK